MLKCEFWLIFHFFKKKIPKKKKIFKLKKFKIGLIEEFNFNVSSNKNRINEVEKSKEVFYVARDGETSSNLTGLKQKIEKTTEFNIHIKFGELFIDSDNGLTKLTGKLTKNSYYFGVSPCCRGASFQILKFWEE